MANNRARAIRKRIAINKEKIAYFREQIDILLNADPEIKKRHCVQDAIGSYIIWINMCNEEINKLYSMLLAESIW